MPDATTRSLTMKAVPLGWTHPIEAEAALTEQKTPVPATAVSRPAAPAPVCAVLGSVKLTGLVQVPIAVIVKSICTYVTLAASSLKVDELFANVAVPQLKAGVNPLALGAVPVSLVPPLANTSVPVNAGLIAAVPSKLTPVAVKPVEPAIPIARGVVSFVAFPAVNPAAVPVKLVPTPADGVPISPP